MLCIFTMWFLTFYYISRERTSVKFSINGTPRQNCFQQASWLGVAQRASANVTFSMFCLLIFQCTLMRSGRAINFPAVVQTTGRSRHASRYRPVSFWNESLKCISSVSVYSFTLWWHLLVICVCLLLRHTFFYRFHGLVTKQSLGSRGAFAVKTREKKRN